MAGARESPRQQHTKAAESKDKREAFKKAPERFCSITAPEAKPLKVFFEEEARFGRINNVARCWVPKGKRAVVQKQIVQEHTYAFSAMCPLEEASYSLISPVCNTTAMYEPLEALSTT